MSRNAAFPSLIRTVASASGRAAAVAQLGGVQDRDHVLHLRGPAPSRPGSTSRKGSRLVEHGRSAARARPGRRPARTATEAPTTGAVAVTWSRAAIGVAGVLRRRPARGEDVVEDSRSTLSPSTSARGLVAEHLRVDLDADLGDRGRVVERRHEVADVATPAAATGTCCHTSPPMPCGRARARSTWPRALSTCAWAVVTSPARRASAPPGDRPGPPRHRPGRRGTAARGAPARRRPAPRCRAGPGACVAPGAVGGSSQPPSGRPAGAIAEIPRRSRHSAGVIGVRWASRAELDGPLDELARCSRPARRG